MEEYIELLPGMIIEDKQTGTQWQIIPDEESSCRDQSLHRRPHVHAKVIQITDDGLVFGPIGYDQAHFSTPYFVNDYSRMLVISRTHKFRPDGWFEI